MSVWLVTCCYMSLTCIIFHAWLHSHMFRYILVCLVTCIILVGLVTSIYHLCLIACIHACVWLLTHFLCTLLFACSHVYSGVMITVVMHEVMVCVVDMVMH